MVWLTRWTSTASPKPAVTTSPSPNSSPAHCRTSVGWASSNTLPVKQILSKPINFVQNVLRCEMCPMTIAATFAYPVFLDLHEVPVLVVGAGPVAARKVSGLAAAGAAVRVVAPEIGIDLDRREVA